MKTQAITSLPPSPEDDRRSRMIKYTIAMSIRVVCVVLLVFVRGWAMWIIAAGAIILPYIAVVLANVGTVAPQPAVERPGAIVPVSRPVRFADDPDDEPTGDPRDDAAGPDAARSGSSRADASSAPDSHRAADAAGPAGAGAGAAASPGAAGSDPGSTSGPKRPPRERPGFGGPAERPAQ